MKIVRFLNDRGSPQYGRLSDDLRRVFVMDGDPFDRDAQFSAESIPMPKLLAPIAPPNIFAIGRNYAAHIAETGARTPEQPLVFGKPTTSVIGPGEAIVLPRSAPDAVDFEAELAIVMGRRARNVSLDRASDFIFGYTCANDVSARDCQRSDKQWCRAKGFDTFCPIGPWIVTADAFDPGNAVIRSRLNGNIMQEACTGEMSHSCAALVQYLSAQFTLLPGTLILTGTPQGVGVARTPPVFLQPGDSIEVEVDGIGTLMNEVACE